MNSFKDSIKSGMTEYLEEFKEKLEGLTDAELRWQANLNSNTIIWLVWHMARVEDNWINGRVAAGTTVWESGGWAQKTGIDAPGNGFGDTPEQVRTFPSVAISDLIDYYDAVRISVFRIIDGTSDDQMSNVVNRVRGPRTCGWILGHVIVEESQHLGQIAFIRGLIRGLNG